MNTKHLLIVLVALCAFSSWAQDTIKYNVAVIANASTGDFAPYMIGSWRHGKVTQKTSALIDASLLQPININQRFSYGFGAEAIMGDASKNSYALWQTDIYSSIEPNNWIERKQGPASIWLQQLYAEIKYRGFFLTLGMKCHESALLNNSLSSGDLIESCNARPIPEARIGFIDFQNIPFTNGWVQIQGEISYGKFVDNAYLKHHFNYFGYHLNLGALYNYKRCYFRTKPSMPFSVTIGMQAGGIFGGETSFYNSGRLMDTQKFSTSLGTFFKMFLPMGENGEDYYLGSTLGSWDLHLRYRLPDNSQIIAYVQKPWEDGSSIGLRNKTDGLWGIEYKAVKSGWLTGAVFELLDFRDQCGPIHWAPSDSNGTTITTEATGRDNYYNNNYYNSYANFGMSIGTPFLVSPLYNLNGYPAYDCNRANGFHLGAMGQINPRICYRALFGYQRGLGTYNNPFYRPKKCTSALIEVGWDAKSLLKGLNVNCQLAIDHGQLRGNNFGSCITLSYSK